jgi:hypothetical protein
VGLTSTCPTTATASPCPNATCCRNRCKSPHPADVGHRHEPRDRTRRRGAGPRVSSG